MFTGSEQLKKWTVVKLSGLSSFTIQNNFLFQHYQLTKPPTPSSLVPVYVYVRESTNIPFYRNKNKNVLNKFKLLTCTKF